MTKVDLEANLDTALSATITSNCQQDGTYDLDIEDYICTKPCPPPTVPDDTIMEHDWTDADKPEYGDTIQ